MTATGHIFGRPYHLENLPNLGPILMQVAPKISSISLQLFCKSHQFLQRRQLDASSQRYSHKPYIDEGMLENLKEELESSPPIKLGEAYFDLFFTYC